MNGAEYIAEFFKHRGITKVFQMQGGACAFIIDALGRHPEVDYVCVQHEQAAAMAADASWRTLRVPGATVATSGPGATNLITGIACSYFDSIPSIHITGQVNQTEKVNYKGADVRQAGFQETKIVEMVRPITKYAVQVTSGEMLKSELTKAYNISISGRMGPVLLDVPMDVQKAEVGNKIEYSVPVEQGASAEVLHQTRDQIKAFFQGSERPLVLVGAGVGLSQGERETFAWLTENGLPFVSSWNGLTYFNHDLKNYMGNIGVYGNRGANFLVQNADRLLVLGSRLDNRQRSGNASSFAPGAKVLAIDVDSEELKKLLNNRDHSTAQLNLKYFGQVVEGLKVSAGSDDWKTFVQEMKSKYFGKNPSTVSEQNNTMSPYAAIQKINKWMDRDAVVIADTGASMCWVFQAFHRTEQEIFTAGGNSPMGYSLPAAIGAALYQPDRQVVCFTGDGGFQLNIQELQTMKTLNLPVKIFVLNNSGYGIMKQFQDANFSSRYHATTHEGGYSAPDFGKIAAAYGIDYVKVEALDQLKEDVLKSPRAVIVDLIVHPQTWIEPKLDMGRSIEDQFPYVSDQDYAAGTRFTKLIRKK